MIGLVEYWAIFQNIVCEDFLVGLFVFRFPGDDWGFVFDEPMISLFIFCVGTMLTVVICSIFTLKKVGRVQKNCCLMTLRCM